MSQGTYVREKIKDSLTALAHAKEKLEQAYLAAGQLVISSPSKIETIRLSKLTPRECVIVKLLALGKNYKQIAHELGISPETVKVHRRNIIKHLKIEDIATLTRVAVRNGLVSAMDV